MTKKYDSKILKTILDSIPEVEMEKTKVKMVIAARIADLLKESGLSKVEFAKKANKLPSEITKWLSGTHNFTVETLCEIASAFNVDFYEVVKKDRKNVKVGEIFKEGNSFYIKLHQYDKSKP